MARRLCLRARPRRPATWAAAFALVAVMLAVPGVAPGTPPTPTIGATQAGPVTTLTSSSGTQWSWTFVDAASKVVGTSAAQNPSVTLAAGNYTAKLDATDDPATPAAHAETSFHVYGLPTASFTSTALADGTVQFTDRSTGEPTTWQWAFPGGASFTGQSPPPQVIAPATPPGTVTLTVTNPAGSHTVSLPVVVNGPPAAAFTISSNPAGVKSPVVLDASSSTDPNKDALTYSWDLNGDKKYGDATGPVQTQTYATPGTYRVGVMVSDGHGGTDTAVDFVTVLQDKPPVVALSASPVEPEVDAPVTFTATASDPDGAVAGLDWDLDDDGRFDDGTGAVATWSFSTPGSRIVAARATDDMGVTTIAFQTINVTGSTTGLSATQPPPRSAPSSSPPDSVSSSRRLLSPFPIVRIRGLIFSGSVRISLLSIKAPKNATVKVLCHGSSCSKKVLVKHVRSGKRSVRFPTLERRMRNGTRIEVFITAPGLIGKYTSFTIRSNAAPVRHDLCLRPGHAKPVACPAQ